MGFDTIEGNLVQYVSINYQSLSYIDFVLYAYNNGKISVDPNLWIKSEMNYEFSLQSDFRCLQIC